MQVPSTGADPDEHRNKPMNPAIPAPRGNELRRARMAHGLSLTQFARSVGVSVACASRWETDVRRPHSSDVERIARLLRHTEVEVRSWFTARPLTTEALPHGKGLRALRSRQGLSREELGQRVGVSAATIAHWECGRRSLPAARLSTLGDVFDIRGNDLIATLLSEPKHIAPPLVQMRSAAGLTQHQVGRRVGVTNARVCAWERGRATPNWAQVRQLARILRRSVRDVARACGVDVPRALHPTQWTIDNLHAIMRDIRVWRGETRQQVADRAGVHWQTVARWEQGHTAPRGKQLRQMERALGLRKGALPVRPKALDRTAT